MAAHSIPFTEEALIKYAKEEAPKFPATGVTWIRTYCDFDDNKFFCEWEAPNKEAIEQIFKDLNIPFDAIYPVRIFDVAKAELAWIIHESRLLQMQGVVHEAVVFHRKWATTQQMRQDRLARR